LTLSRFTPFAALSAALLLGGCGGQTIVRTVTVAGQHTHAAAQQSSSPQTSSATAAPAASTQAGSTTTSASHSASRQAVVGDTLKLQGSNGETMDVTVDSVLDPLAVGVDDVADSGQRFIGVQITLRNVGSTPYSDSPSNGATLLSNNDEQATGEIVTGGPCGNDFQSSANIAPGDQQQGCLPFELPVGETASSFQFTLDSGFAGQTGQWSLAGADNPATTTATPATTIASVAAPTTASPATTPSAVAGAGPVAAVKTYWADIGAHRFGPAFFYLVPGTVEQTESQFVAGERQAGIISVSFSGRVVSEDAANATVAVSSLITHDHQFGCRSWSGSYDLASNEGQWQIVKASITPTSCN
jgi:hypothetical protein